MLDNAAIAELFTREAANATGHLQRAYIRASHEAMMWPEEAAELVEADRSLTELDGIGPTLARRVHEWIDAPPADLEPPPVRSEFLTLAEARRVLARNPSWAKRLKGDLQMHTRWSDGTASIAEMAAAGAARGYQYVAITDHTKGLQVAGGIDEEKLEKQGREIAAVNAQLKKERTSLTVLRAAEVNLSIEGRGDMDSKALAKLDLVLGCFHSALRRTEPQTARYLAGLRNPDIQILGHPQTRMRNRREGLQADWHKVFAEAARLNKAVEIDGDPARQDLRVSLAKIARKEGCLISLSTDAHAPEELAYMELSLATALLAKIPAERIVNFRPLPELKTWVESVREQAFVST